MSNIRPPAVAGIFYPADPQLLQASVDNYLALATTEGTAPKAIIAPHAGYIYSGPIAANAYHLLLSARSTITRVVLLGPSHRIPLTGLALCSADCYSTPLGTIELDHTVDKTLLNLPQVSLLDEAHAMEHSLEVELPFLQTVLDSFSLLPLVVGSASAEEVRAVLDMLWGGDETLVIISSDLSHYHDYNTAQKLDQKTSQAIRSLSPERVESDLACGAIPINGLLLQAKKQGLHATQLDLRNSGDTAGGSGQVVGYGAYRFDYDQ